MAGTGLKVAAKVAGAGLVIADAAGNVVDAVDAFKNGDIAEGLSQSGFATHINMKKNRILRFSILNYVQKVVNYTFQK